MLRDVLLLIERRQKTLLPRLLTLVGLDFGFMPRTARWWGNVHQGRQLQELTHARLTSHLLLLTLCRWDFSVASFSSYDPVWGSLPARANTPEPTVLD
jgi:hypothetical protein